MTPHRPELTALLKRKPEDAIAYLQDKGYKISWDWHETLDDAHSRAFTVAKVAKVDLLHDIRSSLITALEKGQTLEQWKADLIPTLQKKGWWGKQTVINPAGVEQNVQLGSHRRLRTIFDTNMQSAYSAGRYKTMLASTATRPFWEWRHITMQNPRKQHQALNGVLFRADDSFWSVAFPPSEFGCKCRVIARSERESAGREILSSQGYATEYTEQIGISSFTGQPVLAKRVRFDISTQSGQLSFSPAAGFSNSPVTSYAMDAVLAERALKDTTSLNQVAQVLTAPPRLKAHHTFIDNTLSFAYVQNKTSTIAVLDDLAVSKLGSVGNPIILLGDNLVLNNRLLSIEQFKQLPLLMPTLPRYYNPIREHFVYVYDDVALVIENKNTMQVTQIVPTASIDFVELDAL